MARVAQSMKACNYNLLGASVDWGGLDWLTPIKELEQDQGNFTSILTTTTTYHENCMPLAEYLCAIPLSH